MSWTCSLESVHDASGADFPLIAALSDWLPVGSSLVVDRSPTG